MSSAENRVALFGGTFNPIHNGHIAMARAFAGALNLRRVLITPTNIPPHKELSGGILPQQRYAMCCLAVEGDPVLAVCNAELRRTGPSYTVDTLRWLHGEDPDAALYLIMGADMFLTVQQWKNAKEIFRHAVLCAAPRDEAGFRVLASHEEVLHALGARTFLLNLPLMPVSSTEVRRRVRCGESIEGLVPETVRRFIEENALYRG